MSMISSGWSVVIPTIWASNRIFELIRSLDDCEHVNEVILIDNRPEAKSEISGCSKLRVLSRGTNIFVNPAWNWGVEEACSPWVCICNDDVSFGTTVFAEVQAFLDSKPKGVVAGCHRDCFSSREEGVLIEKGHDLGFGWGCVMFCRRESYPHIPENLRIWSGDRYVIAKARAVFAVKFPISTEMSVSSGQSIFDDIKHSDKVLIKSLLTRWESWAVKASERRNGGEKSVRAVTRTFFRFQWQKLR